MKISMFRFYKTQIITGFVYGIVVLIGTIIISTHYATGNILDDCILPICGFSLALIGGLSPVLINIRQLNRVVLKHDSCISYSIFRRKLCEVKYSERVFYSLVDVRFAYAPPVRFIALSNRPFTCEQNPKSIFGKKFYGTYDQNQIILFPYDGQVAPLLNLKDWYKMN